MGESPPKHICNISSEIPNLVGIGSGVTENDQGVLRLNKIQRSARETCWRASCISPLDAMFNGIKNLPLNCFI